MDLGLTGKGAVVVGAGADVGRATALQLAQEGVRVALVGRRRGLLEETAQLITAAGGVAYCLEGDTRDTPSVQRLVAEACEVLGRIDLLANTVGPFPRDPTVTEPMYGHDESWTAVFDTVFMTAVRIGREVIPRMKAAGAGAVVNVAATSARYYNPHTAQYGAMKSAVTHITKNWARDAIRAGVRVNAVLPGWIRIAELEAQLLETAGQSGKTPAQVEQEMVAAHDALYWSGRMGRPDEYADAIVFLLSQRASYINGALMPVDGGSPVW